MQHPTFPTDEHAAIALIVAEYATHVSNVDTVLVVNSCARARAVPESDLDMALLISGDINEAVLEADWATYASSNAEVQRFCHRGPYSAVHIDFFNGAFVPEVWDDGGGPDDFEIEIGNRVVYAAPLDTEGPLLLDLRDRWLPYYDETLRRSRLTMARDACLHDLEFVPFYLGRGLYLQAFDRLYKAFREYLQALFIGQRTYPIAYNKWLDEQLNLVGKQELLDPLLSVLSIDDLKGQGINNKAVVLRELANLVG